MCCKLLGKIEHCLCVADPSWNRKSVDPAALGYGEEVEPMASDSDDDGGGGNTIQWSTASPRGVRRAESLEGPYSLLSLPLPSDAPDSGRRGSDRDSPGRSSHPAVASRSSRSLDERLDELFAKGKLGDGLSPPSSISERSDVEDSDSLSEEELDIIKLRKPVTVTLQPGTSKSGLSRMSRVKSPDPQPSDRKSDDEKAADRATPTAKDDVPLTDDMVDQIVRMKPMQAKAARQPSHLAALNSPDDHENVPVDLSSKPCSSEKVPSLFSDSLSTTSVSMSTDLGSSVGPTVPLPILALSSYCSRPSEGADRGPYTEWQFSSLSGEALSVANAVDKRIENTDVLSPSVLPVPSVSSVQQLTSPSGTDSSVITGLADDTSRCQKRALDPRIRQSVSDTVVTATSRYCQNLVILCESR